MCKRLLDVTLLLVLASNLCWAQYRFHGTFYPLRWGQFDDAVLVRQLYVLGTGKCGASANPWTPPP
jgi:hypothetical protein